MPVFSVVNALARSLGLESDGATSKKLVDSTPATRTSSTDSNTTAVDATEVEVDKVVDGSGPDSLDVVCCPFLLCQLEHLLTLLVCCRRTLSSEKRLSRYVISTNLVCMHVDRRVPTRIHVIQRPQTRAR